MSERKYALLLLSIFVIAVTAIGCSPTLEKKENKKQPVPPSTLSVLDMKLKGDDSGAQRTSVGTQDISDLSEIQKELWSQITSDKENLETLNKAFVEIHRADYLQLHEGNATKVAAARSVDQLISVIESVVNSSNPGQKDQNAFKAEVEAGVESAFGEASYNRDYATLVSYIEDQKMQCFSGTSLFEVARRMRGDSLFKKDMAVVIFTDAHVLPGFMKRVGNSNQFELIGIETTVRGKAKVSFGNTKDLEGVRVVESNFFVAVEIFESMLANPAEVMDNALKITASKYGIPMNKIESQLSTASSGAYLGVSSSKGGKDSRINQSIFAFGDDSRVPYGDQERSSADEIPATVGGSRIAQYGLGRAVEMFGTVVDDDLIENFPVENEMRMMEPDPALVAFAEPCLNEDLNKPLDMGMLVGITPEEGLVEALFDAESQFASESDELKGMDITIIDGEIYYQAQSGERLLIDPRMNDGSSTRIYDRSFQRKLQSAQIVCEGSLYPFDLMGSREGSSATDIAVETEVDESMTTRLVFNEGSNFTCEVNTSPNFKVTNEMTHFAVASLVDRVGQCQVQKLLGDHFKVHSSSEADQDATSADLAMILRRPVDTGYTFQVR